MINSKELSAIVAERLDMPQNDAEAFVDQMFGLVKQSLMDNEQVKIKGLGTFKVQTVKERASVNVNTGEKVMINSHDRITFTPDTAMRDSVNKPFAHFVTVPLNDGVVFDDIEDTSKPLATDIPESVQLQKPIQLGVAKDDAKPARTATEEEKAAEDNTEKVPVSSAKQQETPVTYTQEQEAVNVQETSAEPESVKPTQKLEIIIASQPPVPKPDAKTEVETKAEAETDIESETVAKEKAASPKLAEPADTDGRTLNTEQDMFDNQDVNPSIAKSTDSIVLTILTFIVIFVIGFVIGRGTADITIQDIKSYFNPEPEVKVHIVYKRLPVPTDEPKDSVAKKAKTDGSAAKTEKEAKQSAEKKMAKPEISASTPKQESELEQKSAKPALPAGKYDSDPRIRTGAYIITGVAKTVTAKDGETIEQISKRYLGPGMECYIEALNGTAIKAGQKVKIPELKLKKKQAKPN